MVFCVVTPCKSVKVQRFVETYGHHSFSFSYAGFMNRLLFDPEDGSNTLLRGMGFFPRCTALQPVRSPYFIVSALRTSKPKLQYIHQDLLPLLDIFLFRYS